MSLAIIYRACSLETENKPRKSLRPPWFCKKHCWKGFYREFNRQDTDIYVLFDAAPDETKGDLLNYIQSFKIKEFQFIHCQDNKNSLLTCINFIETLKDKYDFFGLAEDDFEYVQGAGVFTEDALDLGYHPLVLADHPDRYFREHNTRLFLGGTDITLGFDYIGLTNYGHVRTVESTMFTFFFAREWYSNFKKELVDFSQLGEGAPSDRPMWRALLKKKTRLWSPIPTYATHCSEPLSPFFRYSA